MMQGEADANAIRAKQQGAATPDTGQSPGAGEQRYQVLDLDGDQAQVAAAARAKALAGRKRPNAKTKV